MGYIEQFEDGPEKAPDGSDWIDLDTFPLCDICIEALISEADTVIPSIFVHPEHSCDNKKRSFWIECQCACNPGTQGIRFGPPVAGR